MFNFIVAYGNNFLSNKLVDNLLVSCHGYLNVLSIPKTIIIRVPTKITEIYRNSFALNGRTKQPFGKRILFNVLRLKTEFSSMYTFAVRSDLGHQGATDIRLVS